MANSLAPEKVPDLAINETVCFQTNILMSCQRIGKGTWIVVVLPGGNLQKFT